MNYGRQIQKTDPIIVDLLSLPFVVNKVNALESDLNNYHLFHAIRGRLLLEMGYREQARASALKGLGLTQNRAEQSLLARRALEW